MPKIEYNKKNIIQEVRQNNQKQEFKQNSVNETNYKINYANSKNKIVDKISVKQENDNLIIEFEINKKNIFSPCYAINYKITRDIFLATIDKETCSNKIRRTIYNPNSTEKILFYVMDLYNTQNLVQEIIIEINNSHKNMYDNKSNQNKEHKIKQEPRKQEDNKNVKVAKQLKF